MEIPNFVWVFGFIVTIILSTTTIAYFFNIETVNYIGYLLWFVALAIFYMILSSEQKSVFVS
uniref:Uncharacterized protein n=1 Tax=Nucleocytoviricota sp. TaxID=2809609 RepID=A0A9E8JYX8_9VIRU|nr:hypothetical protein [Nucleocytoviricota sp.]UZT29063.1 hypothetical protein [Nucleocytoviricota sp.]